MKDARDSNEEKTGPEKSGEEPVSGLELSPDEARRRRERLLKSQQEAARAADEKANEADDADSSISTFILPGD
ncbi:MAG: hypothetical protein R3228_10935 [Halioglobus sp.]|nr:hypothetical protein [Halioglobus sp.]